MKIHAFNFSAKPTNFYINQFKEMNFIAVDYEIPQGRTMIRLDDEISMDDVHILGTGTFTDPAIEIKGSHRLVNENRNMNTSILPISSSSMDYALAYIMIDKKHYRLVEYCLTNQLQDERFDIPEIRKEVNTNDRNVAVVQFNLNAELKQYMILVLYNRVMKKYLYYRITIDDQKRLVCDNLTSFVGKAVMKSWEDYDHKNGHKYAAFKMQFNTPSTKAYITLDDDTDDYCNRLLDIITEKSPKLVDPIIFKFDPNYCDEDKQEAFRQIREVLEDNKINVLTWFELQPMEIPKMRIRYNFIMDETGKVMKA